MSDKGSRLPHQGSAAEVEAFLRQVADTPLRPEGSGRGRLLFAMDATASREPTWDAACHIQAQMFEETRALGGLDVQLCFYRGYREFVASPWVSAPGALLQRMTSVTCAAGYTQVVRVLEHALQESLRHRVRALVFVGDCMEEKLEAVIEAAGRLGVAGVTAFMFHEGSDPAAAHAFQEVARLTRGAYCRFDSGSARQLRDLLTAAAVFASGGREALMRLAEREGGVVRKLGHQMAGA